MKLTSIIIDDERLARRELRSLLAGFSEISIIGEAENLTEAINIIQNQKPDVVFLDIQLSNENGFDLLEKVENDFKLIFVTAFDEFAIRAFEINALDYLLKPVNPERLAKNLKRLLETEEKTEVVCRKLEYEDRLFIEMGERSRFLKISSIKCICADGDYTNVFTDDGKKNIWSPNHSKNGKIVCPINILSGFIVRQLLISSLSKKWKRGLVVLIKFTCVK